MYTCLLIFEMNKSFCQVVEHSFFLKDENLRPFCPPKLLPLQPLESKTNIACSPTTTKCLKNVIIQNDLYRFVCSCAYSRMKIVNDILLVYKFRLRKEMQRSTLSGTEDEGLQEIAKYTTLRQATMVKHVFPMYKNKSTTVPKHGNCHKTNKL